MGYAEKLEIVNLEDLKFSKNRVRKRINREELLTMAKSIKAFGVMQPLEINENNEVILGTRRFEAAKLASLKEVQVIRRSTSELYEIEKQLVSDIHTEHISLIDRANAFHKLIELKRITKYALARYLCLSDNIICRTLAILEANKTTSQLIKEGKISERTAASVLYRLKDKSKEDYIMEKIVREKMSVEQAENLVAEINDSNILNKHFLKQVKGFKTSLKKYMEKSKLSKINLEKDVADELDDIKRLINN
jgi:ParB family chromosome partitioning protein